MESEYREHNISIEGSQNIIGDSNTLTFNEYKDEKTNFFEPNLTRYSPPQFISPPFIESLKAKSREQRLIIIGGNPDINTSALARHTAWHLWEKQKGELSVKEWFEGSDPRGLDIALRDFTDPTIFILPDLLPQHTNYNPIRLKKIAEENEHVIIASSSLSVKAWNLSDVATLVWHEVSFSDYSIDYLVQVLRKRLTDVQEKLPSPITNLDWGQQDNLIENLHLTEVVKKLKTPENIAILVDFLCLEEQLNIENLQQIINRVQDHELALKQWYYQLKPRKQLLTVALNFFDGLFDDQFFTALDTVIENCWRRRDPLTRLYDYYELNEVQSIFNFTDSEAEGTKIESYSTERRQSLLSMAWKNHRRYVLSTLPQLANLVKKSVNNRSSNLELYGTELKRQQLRSVIGQTISDIGLISAGAIQETLLQLATDDNPKVQVVAAQAVARWRLFNREKELFETLESWQRESRLRELVDLLLEERDEKKYSAYTYIRSTVALAVAFASAYDEPNKLDQRVKNLFESLSNDINPFVKHRFATYTLPLVVERHWQQVSDILRKIILDNKLIPSVSNSLSRAYRFYPNEILELLDSWQYEAQSLPKKIASSPPQRRECLLATVSLTYGYIPYNSRIGPLTAEEGFNKLESILADKTEHPFVRIAVLQAIAVKANTRFDEIEPYLRNLVASLQPDERHQVVRLITTIYLEQRANLKNGERIARVNRKTYEIWINTNRPLTEIEKTMYSWTKQSRNASAQQIALQAFISFAENLDQQLEEIKEEIKEEMQKAEQEAEQDVEEIENDNEKTEFNFGLGLQAAIALWIVTLGRKENLKRIISGIFPEAVKQSRQNHSTLQFVLDKWKRISNDEVKETANRLNTSISLVRNNIILIIMGLLGFLLLCTLCSIFGNI